MKILSSIKTEAFFEVRFDINLKYALLKIIELYLVNRKEKTKLDIKNYIQNLFFKIISYLFSGICNRNRDIYYKKKSNL